MTAPNPLAPVLCWPILTDCLPSAWQDYEGDVAAAAQELAESVLRGLTLQRVGGCPIKVRPCLQRPYRAVQPYGQWMTPYQSAVDGQVRNYTPCQTGDCEGSCEINLGTVIGRVDQIKVNGQALDIAGKLAVIDGSVLAWRGPGACPFPKANDMTKADTEAGTWSITYLPAHPVDQAGARALAWLTFEFAKAICNADNCKLPSNVTQVVRQGVSLTLVPGLFLNGQTGIREVDTWVRRWNPLGRKQPTVVLGPNTVQHRTEVAL